MKRLLVIVVLCLIGGVSTAVPVNFTEWEVYGDAWKCNNDTYTLVKYNSTGTHTWIANGNASTLDEYIIIAGGGGGGRLSDGGAASGGGAGGVVDSFSLPVSGSISVVVGAGGNGATADNTNGGKGGNSSFSTVVAIGGASGCGGAGSVYTGLTGGSGSGGCAVSTGTVTGGAGTAGQGFAGGNGVVSATASQRNAGGGGGNGTVGAASSTAAPGKGGNGTVISIDGVGVCYAAGGGGGSYSATASAGGKCIDGSLAGGAGGSGAAGSAAVAERGSGGGGGGRANNGGNGSSGVIILEYTTALPPESPVAAFSCTPTSTTLGNPIVCTDASSDTPTNWTYIWGDGNITTTEQNPTYTYPFTGTFTINMSANNTVGIDWENKTDYITITNVTSFTQQDIYLTGQYTITFNVKSSTTNLPIANVTVVDSVSGQSYPSTNGTAFLTLPAGLYYINFIADGYQSKQVTYVVDQDETHTVTMVPSAAAPTRSISNWYSPHQVRFAVVDSMGVKVVGSTINASAIATTLPTDGTADWLTAMYGIDPAAANDMLNGTLIMHGITQSDGATVFTMHSSIGYSLAVTNPSNGVTQNVNVTPIDTIYTIHLLGTAANNTYMDMGYNTSLYITEPDVHNVTMNLAYQDMSARTTLLEFFVLARSNNTVINYQSTSSIGSDVILMNYTVPNVRPDRYSWYYNAVRVK